MLRVDAWLVQAINLYSGSSANVNDIESEEFVVNVVIYQGLVLHLLLFYYIGLSITNRL